MTIDNGRFLRIVAMQALSFYLLYPLIYLTSKCPFWVLYRISDLLYLVVFLGMRYRKKVVVTNLKNAFPEKSEKEIEKITKSFYRYLCDLVVETLKTITWTKEQANERIKLRGTEKLDSWFNEGKSIVAVMGHHGNWEWAGPCYSLNSKYPLSVVYQPLSNKYFEKVLIRSRTRFNTKMIPRNKTMRALVEGMSEITTLALIADQAPPSIKTASWMKFLNQETAVYNGPEKMAKKMDHIVVFMSVNRIKRGYYEIIPKLITEKPKQTSEGEITQTFNQMLEEAIKEQPETWLWSHRRWKHKRPTDE